MIQRCGNCRFRSSPPGGHTGHICRRRAPSPANIFDTNAFRDGGVAFWPVVDPKADWCGDWQLSEDSEQEEWD